MTFKQAAKICPVSYDPLAHLSIEDLRFQVIHELDLIEEQPEEWEDQKEMRKLEKQCRRFLVLTS